MAKENARPLYDCVVLLDGSRDNTVALYGVTAAELAVIRVLHGAGGIDPLASVTPTGKGVERSDEQERARIANRYRAPGKNSGLAILDARFGVGNKLPMEYEKPAEAVDHDAPAPEDETVVDLEPEGPITSTPEPKPVIKKTAKSTMLDDEP